jgi:hypothetical protein
MNRAFFTSASGTIDEYDNLLMDVANTKLYGTIKEYLQDVYQLAFKDNPNINIGLLTGTYGHYKNI